MSCLSRILGRANRRRLSLTPTARALLAFILAMTGGMLSSQAAVALPSRGHVFQTTFSGTGEQALRRPDGIAVDESTGEVYVADRVPAHEQVERFKPDGEGGYEFVSAFKVKSPAAIAVDNSSDLEDPSRGDVYVVGAEEEEAGPEEHTVLYKYSPSTAKLIFKKTIFHSEQEELELEEIYGVAVDAEGGVWVYWGEEGVVSSFDNAEKNKWRPTSSKELEVESKFECRARPGFAVAPHAEYFYVAHERETGLGECPEEESTPSLVAKFSADGRVLARGVDHEPSTGAAVDGANGDLYVDNVGSVAAFDAAGAFIQRFGDGTLSAGGPLAMDSARSLVYVAEPTVGRVAVFAGEEAGNPPAIDGVFAQALSPSSERLVAQIDPRGADTHYYFQYGTADCALDPGECTDVPVLPGGDLGEGFGDRSAAVELSGLEANATYHYRVLAENAHGIAESRQSAQTFFTTLPSAEGLLADSRAWEMVSPPEKHGAAIESISREGALIQAAAGGDKLTWAATAPTSAEAEGNRRPEVVQVLSGRDAATGWSSRDITTPHNRGEGFNTGEATEYRYFSGDLSLALVQPQVPSQPLEDPPLAPGASEKTLYARDNATGGYEPLVTPATVQSGERFGGKLGFQGASSDLRHVVFSSEVPLLTGAVSAGLYEWESGGSQTLVSVLPGTSTPAVEPQLGDEGTNVRNAISRDGSRVFWTQGEADEGPLYMRDTAKGETVQLDAVQGEGLAQANLQEREEHLAEVHFQGASADGSRAFFTDAWPLTTDSTLEPLEEEEVTEGEEARGAGRPADLYEFDVATGKLTDLTPDQHVGENADVLGTLPGISEDGSRVYFVANGALAAGAEPGDCPRTTPKLPHPQAACNLYASELDPQQPGRRLTRLIARLSYEDAGDWGQRHSAGDQSGVLGDVTSHASANGRYLAFMSQVPLTGYDNVDAGPAAKGAHDQEVFLYDAAAGAVVCASCNPSGAQPHGVLDVEDSGEGLGLLVDRPETWKDAWLAGSIPGWTLVGLTQANYQSRYLSDNGRLFFNSPDRLVEQDGNGKEDVYEYEPQGLGSCARSGGCVALVSSGTAPHESAFLDASENGADAFFLTSASLLAQDTDKGFDIYDARICGTSSTQPCLPGVTPPPPACTGEACRPPRSSQEDFAPPASSTFSGPGNLAKQEVSSALTSKPASSKPPSRAQKLTKALKACRKLKSRHKRQVCEASARKRYGAKGKGKRATGKSAAARRAKPVGSRAGGIG